MSRLTPLIDSPGDKKWKEVEFLIEGNLSLITMGSLQVSKYLLVSASWPKGEIADPSGESKSYTLAFVAVPQVSPGADFQAARQYLDLFLLLYALRTDEPCTFFVGVGHPLRDLESLGKQRVSFPSFEPVESMDPSNPQSPFVRPVLETATFFRELEALQQDLMKSFVGLSLRYYYYALQASRHGRIPEITINLSTALEALVSTNEDFTRNLRERISSLIKNDPTESAKISKGIANLYNARSRILHGSILVEDLKIRRSQLVEYFSYTRRAIEKVIALRKFNKHDLVSFLDE